VIEDYTFDAMDRMDLMAHRRASDNAVLASYDYTYRADGKRTGLNESFATTTARSNSYTWSYDNAGRLISEVLDSSDNSVDQTESYVYDLVGNRMRKDINKPATAYVDSVFAYNYDANDRITSETLDNGVNGAGVDQTTTYGWNGTQQTSKSVSVPTVSTVTQSMSYGLGGQLERVITTTQNGSGTVTARTQVEYRYDPTGIRFIAIDSTDSNLGTPGIERIENGRTEYLIDRANFTGYQQTILETVKNAAGQANKRTSYTFGVDEITQTVSDLNPANGQVTGSETLAFGHDGHGSVRVLFGASAAIAQIYIYSAYGEMVARYNAAGSLDASAIKTSILYNGEGLDARTGLYNMRARWYSAANARWERLDPFNGNPTDPFSFNKYGFVHADPVQGIDPTGMFGIGGGMIGIGINIGLQLSAPSIGDSIRGALQSLVTEYALNLEFDIAWAQDWSLSDSESTRSDNQWVVDAIQQGALDPWMGIVRLLGGDLSDDGEDDPANGGNAAAMAARPRPPVRLPATGMAAVRSVHSSNGELKSAFAQITPANIGKGTGTTAAARRYVRKLGKPNDDAGHAIGKELGGDGSVRGRNVFPQSPHFNRGLQRQIEADIKKDVLAGKQVFVRVVPKYHPGSTRPHQITYQVRTDGVTKLHPILNP
jgi:RHS repeat-associated protein